MTYSQYLQQGGSIQDQAVSLVKAAMNDDQQAVSEINKIMQAAQNGDLKSILLAQLIQLIAKQLQGQTEEETETMENGGSIMKGENGFHIPKAKTKVKGNITYQSEDGDNFELAVVYPNKAGYIDSIAVNSKYGQEPVQRYVINFADAPKGRVPYEEFKQIDENGNIGFADYPDRNWIKTSTKKWEIPSYWNITGTTSNGLNLVPVNKKGGKVKKCETPAEPITLNNDSILKLDKNNYSLYPRLKPGMKVSLNGKVGTILPPKFPKEKLKRYQYINGTDTVNALLTNNKIEYIDPSGRKLISSVSMKEKGGKTSKCSCQLKRIGGKIVEVDGCTGVPIHRGGQN